MGFFGLASGRDSSSPRRARVEPGFRAASPENPTVPLSNPDAWLLDWANGGVPLFGPPVSEQTSLAVSTVYRCVSLISGLIAGLPLIVYRDDPVKGRQPVTPDVKDDVHSDGMRRLGRMLAQVPFPGRPGTAFAWRETMAAHLLLWGNAFSVIRYDAAGRVIGFEAAPPTTEVVRLPTGRNLYTVTWPSGTREAVTQENMLHVMGASVDGIRGMSRIRANARNSVALSRMLEEQAGRVHENSAKPSGMVTVPANISPEGKRKMEAFFAERYAGRLNAGKVLFADAGSEFTPFQMSPVDLATIATRQYAASDICRFFGVPPHLVGEAAGTSAWGSGIEQLTIGFHCYTLEAEFRRIESEINNKLLLGQPYEARFDREALTATDAKTYAAATSARINSGQLLINEARRKQGLPAVEGGDEPLVNSTIIPLKRALAQPQAVPNPIDPAPDNAPADGDEPAEDESTDPKQDAQP